MAEKIKCGPELTAFLERMAAEERMKEAHYKYHDGVEYKKVEDIAPKEEATEFVSTFRSAADEYRSGRK